MSWLTRLFLIAIGLIFIAAGICQLQTGHFVFTEASRHQTAFFSANIAAGIVLIAFAFLPRQDWLYRHITTRREKWKLHQYSKRHHNNTTD